MYLSDPREVEDVLAFFHEHAGKELEIAICVFDGLTETERMHVIHVATAEPANVILRASKSQRELQINPHHYSFATVSPDRKRLEIGRLLGSSVTLRLTASEVNRR
jgi:hypothetical protein